MKTEVEGVHHIQERRQTLRNIAQPFVRLNIDVILEAERMSAFSSVCRKCTPKPLRVELPPYARYDRLALWSFFACSFQELLVESIQMPEDG
jgi:hypothetical protein